MPYNVERLDHIGASGWAFLPQADWLMIEAWSNGALIASTATDIGRPDVVRNHPTAPAASGFRVDFALPGYGTSDVEVSLVARHDGAPPVELIKKRLPSPRSLDAAFAAAEQPKTRTLGPLPKPMMALVEHLQPGIGATSDDEQRQLVEHVKFAAAAMSSVRTCQPLAGYIRFLRGCWQHFTFVDRYFPLTDEARAADAKDRNCKQNSPNGLISIAHHLYVLRSYGVAGDFAEFGCFKGYSSAMLSHACDLLGVRMHVFDSFEGLPATDSDYYQAGDFAGSMPEVRENLRAFGRPEMVTMHPGFYSDSVPKLLRRAPKLAAIWMDVDLATSASDALPMIGKLDARGALFSHESAAEHFADGTVRPLAPAPGNVVAPIIEAFGPDNIAGRHMVGWHGAYWREKTGIPVLSNHALMVLINAL